MWSKVPKRKLDKFRKERALDKKKRERLEKDIDEFRVFAEVFDSSTLMAIYRLLSRGVITGVHGCIRMGKESCIHLAEAEEEVVILKVYRVATSDFRNMWRYIRSDPRFDTIARKRRKVIHTWASREYKNLSTAREAGCSCPEPIQWHENLIVMECIEKEGMPAPRLVDIDCQFPERYLKSLVGDYRALYQEGEIVHGDLSPYNVLESDEGPVMIDFSQGTIKDNPLAVNLLFRDIENLLPYFSKRGLESDVQSLVEDITGVEGIEPDESIAI